MSYFYGSRKIFVDILTHMFLIHTRMFWGCFDVYVLSHFRSCIPAEAEPLLNSSGCYPLVNFTRPFCQNHGVTLPDRIFRTPHQQRLYNNHGNNEFDPIFRLGIPKISRYLKVDNDTLIKCLNAAVPIVCHYKFPSCEGTKNQYKQQKTCRETCLKILRICGKMYHTLAKLYVIKNPSPESKKFVHCKLQPQRNAGDSPECWYYDPESSTGNI